MAQVTWIEDAGRWDAFVCAHPCGHFLQRWAWGALKQQFGWQPARVALCDGEQLRAGAQILFRTFPLGAMGYIPRGPVIAPDSPLWPQWLDALRQVARRYRACFIRMEPDWERTPSPTPVSPLLIAKPGAAVQPPTTIHVDLRPAPEAILAQMKPKWRYNIRLAERKGIAVRTGGEADLAAFYRLSQVTARRDAFAIHSEDYYRTAWRLFDADGAVALFVAEYEGRAIASIFVVACGRTAIYLYGASSDEERNRMPNHLLQWRAMLWAKERGCEVYDLWGIPGVDGGREGDGGRRTADGGGKRDGGPQTVHGGGQVAAGGGRSTEKAGERLPEGLLRFKEGFGGRIVQYQGAFDVVYNRPLYRALDYLIAKRRGLA